MQNGATYNRWTAYGQAKTANMLMALSLAEKLGPKGLHAFSLHPGVIMTNLANHLDWETNELRECPIVPTSPRRYGANFRFRDG